MSSPALQIAERHARPLVPTLFEELLEEIFLRLPTPDALARASTACTSFHRIITARAFLRRFRKLHPPPLLGFLAGGFHAAESPHPSAPLARAVASAADFSYSFVPPRNGYERWVKCDVRDGRVLLESVFGDYKTNSFQYLACGKRRAATFRSWLNVEIETPTRTHSLRTYMMHALGHQS